MKKAITTISIIIVILLMVAIFIYIKYFSNGIVLGQTSNLNTITNDVNNKIVVDIDETNNLSENESLETQYNKNPYNGDFELPINGATAFASVSLPLYKEIGSDVVVKTVGPGQAFKIISESDDYFYVQLSDSTNGYIQSNYCLVNLPDLIPSIIYDDTNSYESIFRSSGYALDNITGKALYNVYYYNDRLEQKQYLMPLLYPMAKKIAKVQKEALANNDCLKIYETFRPYEVQMKVSDALTELMESNEEVKQGITAPPWDKSWFIAVQLSNHQRGIALDVSLSKVKEKDFKYCGSYIYFTVSDYEEYKMPTRMHELSKAAATFTTPVSSKSKTDWQKARLASSMNSASKKLQNYFTSYGLTPLASEWWHFNDLDTRELTKDKGSNGRYYLTQCLSSKPSDS